MSNNIKRVDGWVDSVKLRLDYVDKGYRDFTFSEIISFIKSKKLVSIQYDKEKSNQYCQIIKLISSNTTIATLSKNSYTTFKTIKQYTITISFYGLKRYQKEIDKRSLLLLKNIAAFLNSDNNYFSITELDICTDYDCHIDNLVAVCVNRKSRKKYNPLGEEDVDGKRVQKHKGTYDVEKFESHEKSKNVKKRAYLYNKRNKEIQKANNDLGYDLSRFEVKLQSRFFLDGIVSVGSFLEELKDYQLLHFKDLKQKHRFINKYNKANNNKHRKEILEKLSDNVMIVLPNMIHIGTFIRMIDTIRFDQKGNFRVIPREDYLYGLSKFNQRK